MLFEGLKMFKSPKSIQCYPFAVVHAISIDKSFISLSVFTEYNLAIRRAYIGPQSSVARHPVPRVPPVLDGDPQKTEVRDTAAERGGNERTNQDREKPIKCV